MKDHFNCKIKKFITTLFIVSACLLIFICPIQADETTTFHVQTAAVNTDGTIEVSVYLTGASNLGAVDAELIYDPSKVSFVDAQLGESLKSTYADAYNNEEKSLIKYVILYAEPQEAHGILLKATFHLKEGNSYQPQLNVVDIVDNSDEIRDIPYTVTYQQADGSWTDQQDTSGIKAEPEVIEEALETYGAAADQKEAGQRETDDSVQEEQSKNDNQIENEMAESEIPDAGSNTEAETIAQTDEYQSQISAEVNQEDPAVAYVIGGIIVVALAAGRFLSVIRKKKSQ